MGLCCMHLWTPADASRGRSEYFFLVLSSAAFLGVVRRGGFFSRIYPAESSTVGILSIGFIYFYRVNSLTPWPFRKKLRAPLLFWGSLLNFGRFRRSWRGSKVVWGSGGAFCAKYIEGFVPIFFGGNLSWWRVLIFNMFIFMVLSFGASSMRQPSRCSLLKVLQLFLTPRLSALVFFMIPHVLLVSVFSTSLYCNPLITKFLLGFLPFYLTGFLVAAVFHLIVSKEERLK